MLLRVLLLVVLVVLAPSTSTACSRDAASGNGRSKPDLVLATPINASTVATEIAIVRGILGKRLVSFMA